MKLAYVYTWYKDDNDPNGLLKYGYRIYTYIYVCIHEHIYTSNCCVHTCSVALLSLAANNS
jgi:hypothetical protein